MKQVLGMDQAPGASDSFFDLGGDSIRAIRLVSLLREMGLQVSVADIMKQKTVRGIARCAESAGTAAISQEPYEGAVPDSAIVAFFKDMKLPCPGHYNQTRLLALSGRAGRDSLQKAWDALVYQHDMLRAVFKDETLFVRGADTTIEVEEYTVRSDNGNDHSEENREAVKNSRSTAENKEAVTGICKMIQTGISMEKALVRTALIHGISHDYLYIAVHHLVIDGVSWRIILSDLETAYGQVLKGEKIHLPSKTNTYNDYARTLLRFRDSYILSLELPYWKAVQKKLADLGTAD
jgi:aryl carrier-like protein